MPELQKSENFVQSIIKQKQAKMSKVVDEVNKMLSHCNLTAIHMHVIIKEENLKKKGEA